MHHQQLVGATAYETWVRTLQAWTQDPSVPLDHLPQLEDDTYTPETYARLFEYVTTALAAVTQRWSEHLLSASARAKDPHDLARELHQLRPILARRVQLARLPAHPPGIRAILEEDLRSTVTRLQGELEQNVRNQSDRGRLDDGTRERLLRVVRENSFIAVLAYSVNERGSVSSPSLPEHVPGPAVAGSPTSSRWAQRRRIIPDIEQKG